MITLLACERDAEPTAPTGVGPPVGVSVSPTALSLIVGRSGTLTAQAVDDKGRRVSVSVVWSSSDPTIATVGPTDGYVVAVSPGSAIMTAAVDAAVGTLTAQATVSVRPPDPPLAVSVSPTTMSLTVGTAERLDARATDAARRIVNVSFVWASANPAVATVSSDGVVTAISVGTTTVTVTTGTLSATATVSVVEFTGSFAFTRGSSSGADVLFYSSDEPTLRSLPRLPEFGSVGSPAWSADGTRLAVEVIHAFFGPPDYEWSEHTSDLFVLDATAPTASPWRKLTTNGLSASPTWSPDGRRIAYLERDVLYSETNHISVVDVDGGVPVRLTLANGYYGRPRWSPDGRRLTFSAFTGGSERAQVFVVNADGSGLTMITPSGLYDYDPSWSPDGTQLLFMRYRNELPAPQNFALIASDVNGANVRIIVPSISYAAEPTWSPDGRRILLSVAGGVHVVNADGSQLTRLTTPPDGWSDNSPAWLR